MSIGRKGSEISRNTTTTTSQRFLVMLGNQVSRWALILGFIGIGWVGSAGADAGVGQAAPDCQLSALAGGTGSSLKAFAGQVLYVDFWASWCGPCVQSFPYMNQLHREFGDKGLKVIAINLDEDPNDARGFLAQHPAEFLVAADPSGTCPTAFGVKAMPSTFLVDRNGIVRDVHLGFRPGEAQQSRSLVERLVQNPGSRELSATGAE